MNSKNTRKTLIGTFIGMMALTAASAATAGVAWFTTTRTAIVHFPNASVTSNRGELKVGKIGTNPTVKEYALGEQDGYDAVMDSISSYDGVNFYNALLDVDGSEMDKFFKDATPNYAQFGFSAGTQSNAETDLSIYLEEMDIKVTDVNTDTLTGDAVLTDEDSNPETPDVYVGTKEKVLSKTPLEGDAAELVVKLNGAEINTYTYDSANNKIVLNAAPRADDPETDATDPDIVEISYRYEVGNDDPILNSIRVALFASNEENATIQSVAVEKNQTLVWDTTDDGEDHYGVTVTAEDANHSNEEHYVRKASERFFDLDYAIDSGDNDEGITTLTFKHGEAEAVTLDQNQYSVVGRRVTISDDELQIARGDLFKVTYVADTVSKKAMPGNVASKIDGYYIGDDLKDATTDGDLTAYGAYLGETNGSSFLNVVARVWVEGTDDDHKEKGNDPAWSEYTETDSIDLTGHDYKVAMDLHLDAIDANIR